MGPVSPPSTSALKLFWDMRHIFRVWGIGREERREYGRLVRQLLRILSEFQALGRRCPDAMAYRYPFYRQQWESEHKRIPENVLNHLSDTLNTLSRFGWTDSQLEKFPLLFFPETFFANVALTQTIKGETVIEALEQHEALLRGLQKKGPFSDIERRLAIANKRATGITPLN